MTSTDNTTTIDGLTLHEHRELGLALATAMQYLDALAGCDSATEERRAEYERMGRDVDAVLDALADAFEDATQGRESDRYPYPRFIVDGQAIRTV